MSAILYYLIIKPLSLLPLWLLHRIADILYFLVYYIIGYRKKVVFNNLSIAFPEKNDKERQEIAKGFYRNFCDVIIESVKLFSISEKELKKRFVMHDLDNLKPYFDKGQSVIGLISHVSNWEWMVISDAVMDHKVVGIITPLTNAFLYKKTMQSRSRFGCKVTPTNKIASVILKDEEPSVYFFASDQSPHKGKIPYAYWTEFFGVTTPVQFGAEKFAKRYNMPVFNFKIRRIKRGYYEVHNSPLELDPQKSKYGKIMDEYSKRLEKHIRENPSDWLWTHRRWKHTKN